MKNYKHLIFIILSIFFLVIVSSCATYKGNYTTHTIVLPLDIDRQEGKWLIDEPILEKIDVSYNIKVIEYFQNKLNNKFHTLKQIGDFNNISSLKKVLEKDLNTLDYYKTKTQFDYLISTKMKLNVDDYNLTKELYIKIVTYNMNNKEKIFEKEYLFKDDFTGSNDSPLPSNLRRFLKISINDCIKDFGKDKYWKYKSKTY